MIIKLEKRYPLKLFISYVYIYNNNLSVIYFLKNDMILHQKFESVSCSEYFNHYYRKRTVGCFRYAA